MMAAAENGWTRWPDTSREGYTDIPHRPMEGYLARAAEAVEQCSEVPAHIFLQAGGGETAGRLAHGPGMQLTEGLSLTAQDTSVLRAWMVITPEPGAHACPSKIMVHGKTS